MSPDESRLSYPIDSPRSDAAPVSARSTSTESIPIVTADGGMQPVENRRTRRARLDTDPVSVQAAPSPEAPPAPLPPASVAPAAVAPPQPEAERAMPAWDSVVQSATVQSAAEQSAPAWEPATATSTPPAAPAWEPPAAPAYGLGPTATHGTASASVQDGQSAAHPAPVPSPAGREEPTTLDALLSASDGHASLTPPPATTPSGRPSKPGKRPKAAKGKKAQPEAVPQPVAVAKAPRARADQLRLGGVPKVDLLPPELKAAREWRQARNRSLLIVLLALVLVLAGFGAATGWAQVHALARDIAQSRTDDLLAQQSEFVEVNQVRGDISAAEQALEDASASDIAWIPFLTELSATIPAQSRLTTLTIEMPSPGTPLTAPTDALQGERVATVRFTAMSARVPDVAAWSRAIEQMGGVVFVAPRATSKIEDGAGYEVEMTFDISAERLRNAPDALDEDQPDAEEDAP